MATEAAPVVENTSQVVEKPSDVFEAAFTQLTEDDKTPPAPAVSAAPVVPTGEKTAETPPAAGAEDAGLPPTAAETAAAAAATTKAAEDVAAAEKAKQPAISDDDILKRLGGLLGKAQPQQEPEAQPQPQAPGSQFTQEETGVIDNYVKEFPDIAKAEALIRREEYRNVVAYIFAEIGRELSPVVQTIRTLSERTHLGDLQTAVPDYPVVRDKVIEWAGKQPAYLKAAYDRVITSGTKDEVADLIGRYKAENPTPAAPAAPAVPGVAAPVQGKAPVAPAAPKGELSEAAKKAVAALAPVQTKRSTVAAAPDPQDYDGAFKEFASLANNL